MNICSPEMCLHLALQLWSALLVGDQAPRVRELYERMKAPRQGDLVVETTGFRTAAVRRIGVLLRNVHEPISGWDDAAEPNPGETVWYIQTDAGEARWTNAHFIALPPLDRDQVEKDGWPR